MVSLLYEKTVFFTFFIENFHKIQKNACGEEKSVVN